MVHVFMQRAYEPEIIWILHNRRAPRSAVHPNLSSPCRNAAMRARDSGSSWGFPVIIRTPIRRIRSGCCARAASGHPATAPVKSVMKSQRLT
jgi:hypothetical protein